MKYCKKCGYKVDSYEKTCIVCGNDLLPYKKVSRPEVKEKNPPTKYLERYNINNQGVSFQLKIMAWIIFILGIISSFITFFVLIMFKGIFSGIIWWKIITYPIIIFFSTYLSSLLIRGFAIIVMRHE